ncbi:hypothetical protein CkaCkLH20_09511 [Colletotrichum karsti]|uniref:Uncharacterized protein n=1 Tax=Colletotrichum karsti TaxID=1095194 RepID=A0A9P6LHA3_9PEZI|nr:uncharacterized protein CkaCkLH20_09511 [Colletotrichum karsti]KAF9873001.1 hypothetical protein CkaCkLH20_09511 [Colletotrichum karsti]
MVTWRVSQGLALLAGLALSQAAILPRESNPPNMALRPWVTVGAEGATKTITPTINDGKTTSTFPGSTTLPTADAKGEGSFLLCNPAAGSGGLTQPICAPAKNSEVEGGKTYFGEPFTWDASLFPSPNTVVQIQGDYGVNKFMKEPGHGFTSLEISASQGFFAWSVLKYEMPVGEVLDVQLFLAVPATNGSITSREPGPKVRVVRREKADEPLRRRANVFGIVLPVIFGVLALGGIGWFVWWYGRKKGMFTSRSQGYGVGKSRGQRTDGLRLADGTFTSANRGGVEMMPPPRPPPPSTQTTGTVNAFRQEIDRQERNDKALSMM